ncbi:hypothetical protein GCM10023107_79070 [Actinoplanes octamycinicus]|nr:hypothetical protein Aoc01nite_63710 [Actinoplanes octamycinicus]
MVTGSLLIQRGDTELAAADLAGRWPPRQFPAPWPRLFGTVAVSPAGDLAVFAGVHALRAVDAGGGLRWELRHGCWSAAACDLAHVSFAEYAGDTGHVYAGRGSVAFSPDGRRLWAHVRSGAHDEQWLVVDPADGTVLARAATGTAGSASAPVPHPDPAFMGLTVDEEPPSLWGHVDGGELRVRRFDAGVLLAATPSGAHLLATDAGQGTLTLHRAADGLPVGRLRADAAVPALPGEDQVCWDVEAAAPWDDAAVAGTEDFTGPVRHWLVALPAMTVRGRIDYPFPVAGPARPATPGRWWTLAPDGAAVHVWTLDRGPDV